MNRTTFPWLRSALGLTLCLLVVAGCERPNDDADTAVDERRLDDLHRRAAGMLARYDYVDAVDLLESVVAEDPSRTDARVDLAIATMNRQFDSDEEDARQMLEEILVDRPDHLRAAYVAGVLHQRAGENELALDRFQRVIDADPGDPYGWYHLGLVNERADPQFAADAYREAVEIDPYLRSAWYRLGSVASRLGDEETANEALETFERLETNPRAVTVKPIYGRLGPKAFAEPEPRTTETAILPDGATWAEPEPIAVEEWNTDADADVAMAVADLDGDGRLDLFAPGVRGGKTPNAVLLGTETGYRPAEDHPLTSPSDVNFAAFGDIDQDGFVDAFLGRKGPDLLLLRDADGGWIDATATAGVAGGDHDTVDGVLIDADHDGDLDVVLAVADGPDRLWNNDRDGGFTDIAPRTGFGGDAGSRQIVAADLDGTRDVDLMVVRDEPPHLVSLNDRLWNYLHDDERFDALRNAAIDHAAVGDLEGDGTVDLVTVDGTDLTRWTLRSPQDLSSEPLPPLDHPTRTLALLDVNGDGGLEIVTDADLGTPGDLLGWTHVLETPGRGWSGILATPDGLRRRSPGPGRFEFTAIELAGGDDATQQMRSNADGLGAIVAARIDDRWTIQPNLRTASGPGQSSQPMPFGLGGAPRLSFLIVDWPDGLFQGEVPGLGDGERDAPTLEAGEICRIPEIQRQVSSCPVLFAHDGDDFRFVSDVLGVAGIGYLLEPGVYSEPRPRERFPMPPGILSPDEEGRLRIVLCEPMEEVCYLDAVELVGWSLPEGWSLAVDERLAIGGPAATGAPIFHRTTIDPVRAFDVDGRPILEAIASVDRVAAAIPEKDRRFIGRLAREHVVTLEFDRPLPPSSEDARPWLLMDGWVEYPYAQTMFAAWQAAATYEAPTLEARDATGTWRIVQEQFGYPAGMPRTAAYPLDALPAGCDALRLRTNQEMYWDRLRVVVGEPAPEGAERIALAPTASRFSPIGFPRRIDGPQRCPDYDWSDRTPLWDVRHQRGRYTRFGAVDELLARADGATVTIGPGEGVDIAFEAPANTDGIHWILDCHGWCKDRDLFTRTGETLEPMPGADLRDARAEALLDSTRTRIEAGR